MTGRQLGQYHIVEKLGEGGMGVVYKARDTRLDRYVALKVLSADRIADQGRKRRFIHEAKAASALNHPNIITVHDIAQQGGVDFIVMEYVSGKTLEAVIRVKGMPVREALRCAVQIADALATAHRVGIIHRDLKPANVMVSESGLVKVVDFGLAKLAERSGHGEQDETRTASTGEPLTGEGTILGTMNYMSPEQAQGMALDARSDIFSFGTVLYQMLTGRRAFDGKTTIDTLSAIIRQEPPAASELKAGLPREIDRIIARCLRKDPARRFQHMEDLKVALEELKEESDSGKLAATNGPRPGRKWLPITAAGVAGLLVVSVGVWWSSQSRNLVPAEPVLTRLTSDSGLTTEPALSPDGKLVAYASDRAGEGSLDIWIQQIAGGEARRLTTDPADDREPHFSPDGSRIVFSSEREGGGLYVISSLGGTERKIAGRGYRPRFSPDGREIAYWVGDRAAGGFAPAATAAYEVRIVSADGGPTRKVQGDLAIASMPVWSPDGAHLIMQGLRTRSEALGERMLDWWVVPTGPGTGTAVGTKAMEVLEARKLYSRTTIIGDVAIAAPELWVQNEVLFAAGDGDRANIWGITLSSKDFKVSGMPRRLTTGVAVEAHPSLWQGPDRMRIVFSNQASNVNIWGLPFDPDVAKPLGDARPLTDNLADDTRPSISADGQLLAYNSNRSGNWDIWLKDLPSGREMAVTSSAADEEGPRVSPDGSEIIYSVREGGTFNSYLLPARGGLSNKIADGCNAFPWASHSRSILCYDPGGLWLLDIGSGKRRQVTTKIASASRLSWDDRWIACYRPAEQPGRSRVFAIPVRDDGPTPENDWVPITNGEYSDALPEFSPDGKLIYFMSLRDGFGCLWAQRVDSTTKKPVGQPYAIQHFHSARRSPGSVRTGQRAISIARNMIVSTMEERTGNIWMTELPR